MVGVFWNTVESIVFATLFSSTAFVVSGVFESILVCPTFAVLPLVVNRGSLKVDSFPIWFGQVLL